MTRNAALTFKAALPPELGSYRAGITEFRNCSTGPLDRLAVHLDRVDDLFQTRRNHGHLTLGQVKLHPGDSIQDLADGLHRSELSQNAISIEPEQVVPDDGIDRAPDAHLTLLGIEDHPLDEEGIVAFDLRAPVI